MQLQKIEPMDPVSAMVFFAGAALFFTLIALLFGSDVAAERRARETLLRDLRSLHPPYRVTVNGLTAACNQKTSRRPVVDYSEETVLSALNSLKGLSLVSTAVGGGSRVIKYKHNFTTGTPRLLSIYTMAK